MWISLSFGDYKSIAPGDKYNTLIGGRTISTQTNGDVLNSTWYGTPGANINSNGGGIFGVRSYTQLGQSVMLSHYSDSANIGCLSGSPFGTTGQRYPTAIGNKLLLAPVYVSEYHPTYGFFPRGVKSGVWVPLHPRPLVDLQTFTGSSGQASGKTFITFDMQIITSGFMQVMHETSDTWSNVQ